MNGEAYLDKFCAINEFTPKEVFAALDFYNGEDGISSRNAEMTHKLYAGSTMKKLAEEYGITVCRVREVIYSVQRRLIIRVENARKSGKFSTVTTIEGLAKASNVSAELVKFVLQYPKACGLETHAVSVTMLSAYLEGTSTVTLAKRYATTEDAMKYSLTRFMCLLSNGLGAMQNQQMSWDGMVSRRTWQSTSAEYGLSVSELKAIVEGAVRSGRLWRRGMRLFFAWSQGVTAFDTVLQSGVPLRELEIELTQVRHLIACLVSDLKCSQAV